MVVNCTIQLALTTVVITSPHYAISKIFLLSSRKRKISLFYALV